MGASCAHYDVLVVTVANDEFASQVAKAVRGQAGRLQYAHRILEERALRHGDPQWSLREAHIRTHDAAFALLSQYLLQSLQGEGEAAGRDVRPTEVREHGIIAATRSYRGGYSLGVALEDDARIVVEGVSDREVEGEPPLLGEVRKRRDERAKLARPPLGRRDASGVEKRVGLLDHAGVAGKAGNSPQRLAHGLVELGRVDKLVQAHEVGLVSEPERPFLELARRGATVEQRLQGRDGSADDAPCRRLERVERLGKKRDDLCLGKVAIDAIRAEVLDAKLRELTRLALERRLLAHDRSGVAQAKRKVVRTRPGGNHARYGKRQVGPHHEEAAVAVEELKRRVLKLPSKREQVPILYEGHLDRQIPMSREALANRARNALSRERLRR